MKNIFVYIGSPRGKKSNTVRFAEGILKKVVSKSNNEVKYEIFTPQNVNLKPCMGCSNCFLKASCVLDKSDDMGMIKEKMLKADFIVLGSPVYVHHITSNMKIFIDRIGYWLHLMRLAGKPGIALSTASSNGSDFVLNYLYKIMTYLGIKVVGRFNAFVDYPKQLGNNNFIQKDMLRYANIIFDYIFENKKIESDDILEAIYKAFRTSMLQRKGSDNGEYLYWKKSNMLRCHSFAEVIQYKSKRVF